MYYMIMIYLDLCTYICFVEQKKVDLLCLVIMNVYFYPINYGPLLNNINLEFRLLNVVIYYSPNYTSVASKNKSERRKFSNFQ